MSFHSINWLYAGFGALALLMLVYAWSEKRRKDLLSKFASAKLLPELSQTVSKTKILTKKILFALGVFAVFVALARPQWGYRWEESKSRGIDIVFAIDTSKSMLAEDVKPSRLDRAKLSVLDLLNVLDGDRIGIVAFSGQAFLQCPLTLDYDAFRLSLEALDTNVIQRGGTNIAAAISEAEIAFAKTSNKKVIVLISDGEELESSAIARARQAAKEDVVIYTLGVGGVKGEAIPVRDDSGRLTQLRDENGKIVTSKLNEEVLTQIAKITGGFYEPLTANGMDTIYQDGLKKIPQQELSARMKQLAIERFQIPLGIAIILIALESLIGTRKFFARRRFKTLAIISFAALPAFMLTPQDAQAQRAPTAPTQHRLPAQSAKQAIANAADSSKEQKTSENNPPAPEQKTEKILPRDVFNEGIDLYEKGELSKAKESFIQSMKMSPDDFGLHAKSFYNMGNIDYREAKYSLSTAISAGEEGAKAAQIDRTSAGAIAGGNKLLQQGAPLLEQEKKAVEAAKTEEDKKKALQSSPLKNQQFQQQLKQGISQCEAVEKETENLKKEVSENVSRWENSEKILSDAIADYQNALALNPQIANAAENLQKANVAKENLKKEIQKNKNLGEALSSNEMKQKLELVAKIKEELKKLVRDDNNQQNQDNQQNQQDKQQQNQQNQQNKDQQKQDQQQNQQQNKDQQQNQQDKQKQDQQNQQNKDQDKKEDKDQQEQKPKPQDKQQQSEQSQRDEQAVDNKKQEQQKAQEQKTQQSKEEEKKAQEQAAAQEKELPTEKKEAKKAATAAEEQASEKEKENFRAAVGAMTKGEAKQLLESMKDSDKILPLRGFGEQKNRFEKSYKDW